MVRKNQVLSTRVQVEAVAQLLHRHHGALKVPARPPWTDRCLPERFARLRRLPQSEVTGAVLHSAEVFLRKLSILRKSGDTEVVRSVLGSVGDILLNQFGYEIRHLW